MKTYNFKYQVDNLSKGERINLVKSILAPSLMAAHVYMLEFVNKSNYDNMGQWQYATLLELLGDSELPQPIPE